MPPLALLLTGLTFVVGSLTALLVVLGLFGQSSKGVRARLGPTVDKSAGDAQAPVIRVHVRRAGIARFITTGTSFAKIERSVMLAGQPEGWTVRRVVTAKLAFTSVGGCVLYVMVSDKPSAVSFLMGITAIGVGYFAPDVLIQKRAEARQATIQQELPDVLDQVTISIESGLSFETAFARIGERRIGPLAEEIVRTVQDMRLGMSRRDAYQSLAERTDVDDLRRFIKSIVQAEHYGVSVSSVVKTQAEEIRFKRRKRAEARALKVPVKIIFPLLVCILPVLFIVILTPAFINIGDVL